MGLITAFYRQILILPMFAVRNFDTEKKINAKDSIMYDLGLYYLRSCLKNVLETLLRVKIGLLIGTALRLRYL